MAGVSEDPDDIMSLQEVLDEDKELVDTANAVLGDGDDSQCSYSKVNHLLITSNWWLVLSLTLGLCEPPSPLCMCYMRWWGRGTSWYVSGLLTPLPWWTPIVRTLYQKRFPLWLWQFSFSQSSMYLEACECTTQSTPSSNRGTRLRGFPTVVVLLFWWIYLPPCRIRTL